ncbi:MAG: hypothetical protein EHM87_22450 [Burkholderiales bacterium]|nr:MAG: hypothetical protein EHM87_22450 [Burkholderiales bacterium]
MHDEHFVDLDDFQDEDFEETGPEVVDSFGYLGEAFHRMQAQVLKLRPSQFVGFAMRMPNSETGLLEKFSFEGRRHMVAPYDSPARRVLLVAARQVEKSTLCGNLALSYSCIIPSYKTLYVSPSAMQTKTFSADRLKEPMDTSEILTAFSTGYLAKNIFEKQFVNRSKITLRYSYLTADRTRGIPAYMLILDEIQDIIYDNVPVMEQCTSHAPEALKKYVFAGTPKSLDNTIEHYRSKMSTQGEWVVPCDACGSSAGAGRYWNILGEKNIGKKYLICENCGGRLDPMHADAQWASQVTYRPDKEMFQSFRIPQLMVPWKPWSELIHQYETYPRAKFYNEVLGISFDSGMRPLSLSQVREHCSPDISMCPEDVAKYEGRSFAAPVFMGVDYGTGEHSYTAITLGTYVNMKFVIFYMHRCTGKETEPPVQLEMICDLVRRFNVAVIATDYGGGFDRNDHLVRQFGPQRVHKFQYMARCKKKVEWDGKLLRWKVHRTEVMSDIFNAIKRGVFVFPRWEEFQDPCASDMCNIFSEYSETLRMIQYMHSPDMPDDCFHSLLYCFLGSMIKIPRPDVIAPRREEQTRGPSFGSQEWSPVDQG